MHIDQIALSLLVEIVEFEELLVSSATLKSCVIYSFFYKKKSSQGNF
jgi:hypothetical protein